MTFGSASTAIGPAGSRDMDHLQLTVAEAERFARDARTDLRRLQAALRVAKEDVARARLDLAKAKEALSQALAIQVAKTDSQSGRCGAPKFYLAEPRQSSCHAGRDALIFALGRSAQIARALALD